MRFVKKNWKVFLLGVFIAVASCGFTSKEFNDPNKDKLLLDLINYVLEKGHYDPKDMNDDFSKNVFQNFIESLDPIKRYFLATDLEEFRAYELLIDDQIKSKDFTFFDLVYTRFIERSEGVRSFYGQLLEAPFDFAQTETISTDYETAVYPNNDTELKERWRKQLKYSTLSNYYDLIQDKDKAQEKLLDTAATNKELLIETLSMTDQDMEANARLATKTMLDESYEFTDDLERKDYFALFLNAIVGEFDPHTNYFAPPDRDRFDLRMSGKLEGIGARLQKKSDYITIVEVISGGPVWRGEHLEVGDAILKVQQEDEAEAVSVVGMRVDDAVKLIKGPKGTKVTLTVKRVDGSIDQETI